MWDPYICVAHPELAELFQAAVVGEAGQAGAEVAAEKDRLQAGRPKGQPGAAAVCLRHGQFLSRYRTCKAIGELFGVPVSAAAVASMVSRVAAPLGACLETIRQA